jgi:hypothetical protein
MCLTREQLEERKRLWRERAEETLEALNDDPDDEDWEADFQALHALSILNKATVSG